MKTLLVLSLCLVTQCIFAQASADHKCADFVATATDERLFKLGLDRHHDLREVLKADKQEPEDFLPIWNRDSFIAFGYHVEGSFLMVCWFKDKKKSGLFYFETYSEKEAQVLVSNFDFDFSQANTLSGSLMYDGLFSWSTICDAFPRLTLALAKKSKAADSSTQK